MKKSIFAVLAVFLAAALLIGAGSAATVIYPYTDTGLDNQALYLVNDPTKIIVPVNGVIATDDFTAGIYKLVSAAPADLRAQLDVLLASLPDDIQVQGHSVNKAETGAYTGEFFLTQPDAKIIIEMVGPEGAIAGSNAVGKTVPTTIGLDFIVTPLRSEDTDFQSLWFTTPVGGKTSFLGLADSEYPFFNAFGGWIDANVFRVDTLAEADVPAGQWYVQLKYASIANVAPGYEDYISLTSATKYPFKIATSVNNLEVSKDVIIRGQSFLVTVTGIPGTQVALTIDPNNLDILPGQAGFDYDLGIVTLNSEGKRTIQVDTDPRLDEDSYTITATFLFDMDVQQAKVQVIKGGIDVSAGSESYYLGNEVTFHGNNTETDSVYLYIKGANKPLQVISTLGGGNVNGAIQTDVIPAVLQGNGGIIVNTDGTWTSKKYTLANEFDAGTYTVFALTEPLTFAANSGIGLNWMGQPYIARFVNEAQIDAEDLSYATCSLRLIQPFIDAKATPVVARGDSVVISGHVEGQPAQLLWYVFGQNYFQWGTVTPDTNGDFEKKVSTAGLSTGQYFVVVQHPMYDKLFNVQPFGYGFSEFDAEYAYFNLFVAMGEDPEDPATWTNAQIAAEIGYLTDPSYDQMYDLFYNDIYSFATDKDGNIQDDRWGFIYAYLTGTNPEQIVWDPRDVISSVNTRQTANAAKAVCDLIDEEYVDDIYFKGDFIVETPYIVLNNVADQTQGSTFTITGTTNVAAGAIVTVEVISTKFQAESKVKVSEASYLTQAVKVEAGEKAGSNVWSATFDSTPLVVDSYSAKAEISARDVSAVDGFLLTKGAEQPTATAQPTGPAQPTATAQPTPTSTPGFGALIALAGLGAVAVLVLRRQ